MIQISGSHLLTEVEGSIEVCVETYLNLTDTAGIKPDKKVEFVNNVLTIYVSLGANFSVIGVNVEREVGKNETTFIDYSDLMKAYECDGNDFIPILDYLLELHRKSTDKEMRS
jgi:hypothetical protein